MMKKIKHFTSEKGQSMMELAVGIMILFIFLAGSLMLGAPSSTLLPCATPPRKQRCTGQSIRATATRSETGLIRTG
jgi:hypothetical protein